MLHPRQIHFIKAQDVLLRRILRRIDEELRQPRVGAAVHHILHVHIAQKVAVIHPRRAHRENLHLRIGESQGAAVETHQRRLADAASAREDHQAGGFHGNMEMEQILFLIQQAICRCRFAEAGEEIRFAERFLRRHSGRNRRRDFFYFLAFFFFHRRRLAFWFFHFLHRLWLCLLHLHRRYRHGHGHWPLFFHFRAGKWISRDPASAEEIAVPRHRTQFPAKVLQISPRHEPQRTFLTANDVRQKLRISTVHQREAQGVLADGAEIRTALPHHAGVKGIAPHGREHHPGTDFIFKIFRSRYHHRARPLVIPVPLRHTGNRLVLQEMAAEFIDVPIKSRRVQISKGGDRIIIAVLIHERRAPFLHHVVQHEIFIVPQHRREGNEAVPKDGLQICQRRLLILEGIVLKSDAAHETGEAEVLAFLKTTRQRRHGIHKETIILHPRLRRSPLHHGTHAAKHLPIRRADRRILIEICHILFSFPGAV